MPQQLVVNGGFETGDISGWQYFPAGPAPSIVYSPPEDSLVASASHTVTLQQIVTMGPGIEVNASARLHNFGGAASSELNLFEIDASSNILASHINAHFGAWATVTDSFVTHPDIDRLVMRWKSANNAGTGSNQADQISVLVPATYDQIGSGGVDVGGDSQSSLTTSYLSSGGCQVSGDSSVSLVATWAATGGVEVGGESTVQVRGRTYYVRIAPDRLDADLPGFVVVTRVPARYPHIEVVGTHSQQPVPFDLRSLAGDVATVAIRHDLSDSVNTIFEVTSHD